MFDRSVCDQACSSVVNMNNIVICKFPLRGDCCRHRLPYLIKGSKLPSSPTPWMIPRQRRRFVDAYYEVEVVYYKFKTDAEAVGCLRQQPSIDDRTKLLKR